MKSEADLAKLRSDLEECLRTVDDLGMNVAGVFIAQAIDRLSYHDRCSPPDNARYVIAEGRENEP